ncbi:hypothetical protein [Nonomuraea sp. WAC 01424]|uniref:hypothetical protein n=1 Tax=Nonomuraea sp. WAC 01424 TaxID=2203200 RepID=UPI000F77F3C0|nr:hypothetical protein [Nonomuraea sp. WAC 01424]
MTQPAPATISISVDQLRTLHQDAAALAVLAGAIAEDCGIDLTRTTATLIVPDHDPDVLSLDTYRSHRRPVSR